MSRELYRAISRSMLGKYSVYAANLLSMIVLARVFSPEAFGLLASIIVFFLFFQMLSEAGLAPAIINIKELTTADRNGIFSLTILIAICLGSLFYLLMPVLVMFYGNDQVEKIIPFVAVGLSFHAISVLPKAFLLRDQMFYRVATASAVAEITSTLVTLGLFLFIDPLYALGTKPLVVAFVSCCCIYYFSEKTQFGRPLLGTRFSAIKPLLSFSTYQLGFNIFNYFSRNLDNILVAKYMGAGSLGVYDKAYQLMRYPLMLLTFAMNPAIQPVIRKYADDPGKVEAIHQDFTFKLSMMGALVAVVIYVFSDLIVYLLLGQQWGDVVPIIRILAISIPAQIVLSTSGSFFQALNRADLLFHVGVVSALFTVSAVIVGIMQRDLVALSWAIVIAFHFNFLVAYYVLYTRIFSKSPVHFLFRMLPAGVIVSCTLLATLFNIY